MLNGLDLFSGIGGIGKALEPWVRPVAYCEVDRYAQSVLLSRMADQSIPTAPIWDDITTLSKADWPWWFGTCDVIYGGFPCQDISTAGTGAGLEGKRSGLFFEVVRLIEDFKPRFVFLENVPAIRTRGGQRVGQELARCGYDCRWDVFSAAEFGAPHLRRRWFMLAHNSDYPDGGEIGELLKGSPSKSARGGDVSDANSGGLGIKCRRRSGTHGQSSPIAFNNGAQEFVANADSIRKPPSAEGRHEPRHGIINCSEDVPNTDSQRRQRSWSFCEASGGGVNLSTYVKLWPTPRVSANENRQTKPTPSQMAGKHGKNLSAEVGGQLNPQWVEWLMGYRTGWTVCADWATRWFRPKRGKPL